MIKRKLTEVAVDAFTEYLQDQFVKLRELDLDEDGQKDVDQIIEILSRCGDKTKAALANTNFSTIAAGLEHIIQGTSMIRSSLDHERLAELTKEVSSASKKLSELGHLSIKYVKEKDNR